MYKVYKIIDNTNGNTYYGSTKTTLEKRLKQHINAYNSYLKHNINKCTVICILSNNDYKIELVENVDENIKPKERERYYIENNVCVNIQIPTRTIKEYKSYHYNINKDLYLERSKIQRENNKEEIKEYKRIWSMNNKDKNNEKRKIWYEKNRDKINEKRREKRNLNKDVEI